LKKEALLRYLFLLAASVAILTIFLIPIFIAAKGAPLFLKVPLTEFLFGTDWSPTANHFGAFPLIVGSFLVTLGAVAIGALLGIAVAIFLSEIASSNMARFIRPTVELLAGIPSVIYGFFGIMIIVPLVRRVIGGAGFGFISASLVLAIMILPTIAALTEDTLRSIPKAHKWGSLALGATEWQTIRRVILPSASEGILSAVILGIGRAIGETMAVLMVIGNAPIIPTSLRDPFSTITSTIATDMSYATGLHQQALFALALILFIISMSLVAMLRMVSHQRRAR
jgi:phosphate transport system permease protein